MCRKLSQRMQADLSLKEFEVAWNSGTLGCTEVISEEHHELATSHAHLINHCILINHCMVFDQHHYHIPHQLSWRVAMHEAIKNEEEKEKMTTIILRDH